MFAIVICLVLLMCTLTIWKFYVVCINSRRYVCCSECDVVSNECNEPTSCLGATLSVRTDVKLCIFGILALGVSLVS